MISNIVSSGICNFCLENVFSTSRLWGKHHQAFAELRESAEKEQCALCCTLFEDLLPAKTSEGIDFSHHAIWPLFRWNVRKTTPTRHTQEAVVLKFRPILPLEVHDCSSAINSLPERTFHFYREQGKFFKSYGRTSND